MGDALSPQLIEAAGRGNLIAIYQVFAETRDQAYFAARYYLRDEKEISAVLGDAYLQAFGRMSEYDYRQSFSQYLHQRLAGRAVRQMKAKKINFAVKDAMMAPFDDRELFPEEWLDQEQKRWEVLRMLDSLPDPQKAAAIMHYMGGMQTYQIADAMGVDERAAAFHLSGAKNGLRAAPAPQDPDKPPVMTRLLEREALSTIMPRDTAKLIFEKMAMIFLTGQKVPKEGKVSGGGAPAAVEPAGEGGGGLVRSLITAGVILVLIVGVAVFYKLRWNSNENRVRAEILADYERGKIATQLPDEEDGDLDDLPGGEMDQELDDDAPQNPEDQELDLDADPDGGTIDPPPGTADDDQPEVDPDDPDFDPDAAYADGGMEEEPLPDPFRDEDAMDGGFQENPIGT